MTYPNINAHNYQITYYNTKKQKNKQPATVPGQRILENMSMKTNCEYLTKQGFSTIL